MLVASANIESFWLSDKVSNSITELNIYLLQEIDNLIDENAKEEEQLEKLGVENIKEIQSSRNKLSTLLYSDFADLHNIRKFIKRTLIKTKLTLTSKDKALQSKLNSSFKFIYGR